jgi:EpsI family protein
MRRDKLRLVDALDLDTSGLAAQAMRLRLVEPSPALIAGALMMVGAAIAWENAPERATAALDREPFVLFPARLGEWRAGAPELLAADIERALGADDYHQVNLVSPASPVPVGLFMAWYADQSRGGIHPPEVCLPSSGWEIAWLERTDIAGEIGYPGTFDLNRAIIQKGQTRMMVYYWFDQHGRKVAWDMAAKFYLLVDGITSGQTDGAIVRLTTLIAPDESDAEAEARLLDVLSEIMEPLPRFLPGGG